MSQTAWHSVNGKVKRLTDAAVGIELEDGDGDLVWIPKSQIEGINGDDSQNGEDVSEGQEIAMLLIPKWLGREKNLDETESEE